MIDKLGYVVALARERHFGRAAEACGVTQPTLSAGLKALEDELGVRIVNRSSRFQGLTPEGERVLAWARRLVSDAKAMRQDLAVPQEGLEGSLRLAVIPTALPIVARLTVPLQARHPGLRFLAVSRPSSEILRLVQQFEVDAGLSYLDNEPLGPVQTIDLYEERYRLVCSLEGPGAGRDAVTWAEVARLPLCLLTPDMQNRRIIDQRLQAVGGAAEPTLVSDSMIVLVSHVETGRWCTILPPLMVDAIGRPGTLVSRPIVDPEVSHTVGLLVPRREPLARLTAILVAEARRLARSLQTV